MILDRLVGETFSLVQYDFVDLVYTLLEMAACRYVWFTRVGRGERDVYALCCAPCHALSAHRWG